ncbi:MAG: Pvc16 family protein, partial [Planctomycetota bacterium]
MINLALKYLEVELGEALGLTPGEVKLGHPWKLKDESNLGALISLINLEEESTLRNTSHQVRIGNSAHYKEPPVFLNLFVLFAFDSGDYET